MLVVEYFIVEPIQFTGMYLKVNTHRRAPLNNMYMKRALKGFVSRPGIFPIYMNCTEIVT